MLLFVFLFLLPITSSNAFGLQNLKCLFTRVACRDLQTAKSCGKVLSCIRNVWMWENELNSDFLSKGYAHSAKHRILLRNLRRGMDVDTVISMLEIETPQKPYDVVEKKEEGSQPDANFSPKEQELIDNSQVNNVGALPRFAQERKEDELHENSDFHLLSERIVNHPHSEFNIRVGPLVRSDDHSKSDFYSSTEPTLKNDDHSQSDFDSSTKPTLKNDDHSQSDFDSSTKPTFKNDDHSQSDFDSSTEPTLKNDEHSQSNFDSSTEPTLKNEEHSQSDFDRSTEPTLKSDDHSQSDFDSSTEPTLKSDDDSQSDFYSSNDSTLKSDDHLKFRNAAEPLLEVDNLVFNVEDAEDNSEMRSKSDLKLQRKEQGNSWYSTYNQLSNYESAKKLMPFIYALTSYFKQPIEFLGHKGKNEVHGGTFNERQKVNEASKEGFLLKSEDDAEHQVWKFGGHPLSHEFDSTDQEIVANIFKNNAPRESSVKRISSIFDVKLSHPVSNDCNNCLKMFQQYRKKVYESISNFFMSFCNTDLKAIKEDCTKAVNDLILKLVRRAMHNIPIDKICRKMGLCTYLQVGKESP